MLERLKVEVRGFSPGTDRDHLPALATDGGQESSAAGIALGFCSDNDQTRQLAGKCGIPKARTSAEEMLRIAKRNLTEHFTVVGVTEKFDRSLLLMKRCLGWGRPFYVSDN